MLRIIMKNVATNEEFYRSIDFETKKSYVLRDAKNVDSNDVKESTTTVKLIYQDNMLYQNETDIMTMVGGNIAKTSTLQAFDGFKTRAIVNNIANIREGPPKSTWEIFSPHTALLSDNAFVGFPLSVFLQGAIGVSSPIYSPANLTVEYVGEEVVDGLRSYKVRCAIKASSNARVGDDIRLIWICPSRNYLPIRTEYYPRGWLGKYPPAEIGRMESFREVSKGIWVPVKMKVEVYDMNYQVEDNVRKLNNYREWDIDVKSLQPDYPKEFFSDIEFPDGTTVYMIDNRGEITSTYIQGKSAVTGKAPGKTKTLFIVSIGLIVFGLIWYVVRWWRRS